MKPRDIIAAVANNHYKGDIATYIFTCVDTDEGLDGVPARIREVSDEDGTYVMDFLDGSSLNVIPDDVRIL